MGEKIKKHIIYIILILLISVFFLHDRLSFSVLPAKDDTTGYFPSLVIYKESILKYHDFFPLWNPYFFSGTPYLMKPINSLFFSITNYLTLIFPVAFGININHVLDVFLAGLFMYFLMNYLLKSRKVAFISALIYMLNGYVIRKTVETALSTLTAYVFIPLVLLFLVKTFKSKDWVKYSFIVGIVLAIQVHNGPGLKVFLFTMLMIALFFVVNVIGKNFKNRLIKIILIGAVLSLVLFGLTAERIIPVKSFLPMTSRGSLSYEESASRAIKPNQLFDYLIEPIYKGMPKIQRYGSYGFHIGIVAFLLSLIAIFKKWKNKLVLFFIGTSLLSILIATGSPIFYLLWKYVPPFDSFRYLPRALSIYVFAGSALAGYGASVLFSKYKKHKNKLFFVLVGLIILNLWVFNYDPASYKKEDIYEAINHNYILQNLSKEGGIFRIQTWETRGIDWGTDFYNTHLKLEHIYAYDTVWYPPYFNTYLGIANQQPAKFWGILNTKYITAMSELNISEFEFIKKYDDCDVCYPEIPELKRAWGPYLYENELFLPRAYIVDNAVLVIGDEDSKIQTIYGLMLNNNFDPRNAVIIKGKDSVNNYNIDELKKYNVIILTKDSIDQNSGFILKQYVDNGGRLLPNVVEGKNEISDEDIQNIWSLFSGELNPINDESIVMHNFDKKEVKLNGKYKGMFLVLSEKYSLFPGWVTKAGRKKINILNANAVITAVYLGDNYDSILFTYRPKPYFIGLTITLITTILIVFYFVYRKIIKKKV